MTTHWPASKVQMFPVKMRTYGNKLTFSTPPRNRVSSQRMLELAGCTPMTSRVRCVRRSALAFHV